MKMLLTSGGITNPSIYRELEALLGKPVSESTALCVPTAGYALREGTMLARRFVTGQEEGGMTGLGWKKIGLLELSVLPDLPEALWKEQLLAADALLVNGGDPMFLCHWMKRSGLAELLPSLPLVYVGLSAGSMVMTPRIGSEFVGWTPPGDPSDITLGLVGFSIFPHLNHPMLPENTMEAAVQWAENLSVPAWVVDDQTAFSIRDGSVRVISEGDWKQLNPDS